MQHQKSTRKIIINDYLHSVGFMIGTTYIENESALEQLMQKIREFN